MLDALTRPYNELNNNLLSASIFFNYLLTPGSFGAQTPKNPKKF